MMYCRFYKNVKLQGLTIIAPMMKGRMGANCGEVLTLLMKWCNII